MASYKYEYEYNYEYEYESTVNMMKETCFEEVSYSYSFFEVFGSECIDYYHARKDFHKIKQWFDMVSAPIDKEKQMRRLEWNADNVSDMHIHLREAKDKYKRVNGLTRAECLVVMMYTGDVGRQYNTDSAEGIWKEYIMFTRLLMSALKELGRNRANRPPSNKPLYRGIRKDLDPPAASRVFWKTFTSTTLNLKTAKEFAERGGNHGIILKFLPPHSPHAVKVGELSSFPEEEVLIPPFVAFDVLGRDGNGFYCFKTSRRQEFLD